MTIIELRPTVTPMSAEQRDQFERDGYLTGDHQWGHYPDTTPLYGYLRERDFLDPGYPSLIP